MPLESIVKLDSRDAWRHLISSPPAAGSGWGEPKSMAGVGRRRMGCSAEVDVAFGVGDSSQETRADWWSVNRIGLAEWLGRPERASFTASARQRHSHPRSEHVPT